jgi:hypothetical protein
MRAISTLRLSDKERELFRRALEYYGYENAAVFLRAAAQALIVAHHHKDSLGPALSFEVTRSSHPTGAESPAQPIR